LILGLGEQRIVAAMRKRTPLAALVIAGQPAGMLFDANGTVVGQWSGPIPEDEVLAAVAEL
jgi:hypothetical protein